ncbi:unnamed protein product [Didymodactylos carnosus]|uniref:CCHC-type domain-containing protein n=2 Tax=Didymodactylos carnosus TaxID=1234261 RepID=A0A8S2VA66_9BILA|nr:unnamed protein product [Didymodactylos carnosus]CAF4359403.1 unnamed protein product [Didymodactylos carnosus]
MIEAKDEVLYCMCTAKLNGEAQRWYEDNTSLTEWNVLKEALFERFEPTESLSKIFEQLKERKQQSDETITSYYDAIIKLCREYDPSMSQRMMISWLENGVKDSLKIQIKRQMKALTESARTIQAFFKIAKDEQELQQDNFSELQPTQSYLPYFNNTVSTTLPRTTNQFQNPPPQTYTNSQRSNVSYRPNPPYVRLQDPPNLQTSLAKSYNSVNSQRSSIVRPRSSFSFNNIRQSQRTNGPSSDTLQQHTRQYDPCSICHQINHRTIDCYYRKSNGCYNCGHSGHQVRDCPQVFR